MQLLNVTVKGKFYKTVVRSATIHPIRSADEDTIERIETLLNGLETMPLAHLLRFSAFVFSS